MSKVSTEDHEGLIEIKDIDALPLKILTMIETADQYISHAYAPYSNFYVGAAAMTEDGKIFGGANQENAAYPMCMCGERVAIYHAAGANPNIPIIAIAITVKNAKMTMDKPVLPCGACRQVILEYESRAKKPIAIYILTDTGKVYLSSSASSLLPYQFNQDFLI